ncbi:MAG: AI-2E family transporter [Flavobacteriales bacterium]|nr:AI-2E family transporter [Flavobacteriales bacterium]
MSADRPITLDRLVRIISGILVLAILVWLLYYLRAVLVPFFVALVLAYLLDPWVARVKKLVKNHTAAVLITLSAMFLLVAGLLAIIVPQVVDEMHHFAVLMANELPAWQAQVRHIPWIHDALAEASSIDVQGYLTGENLSKLAQKVLPGFWQGMSSVFGWLLGLVGVFTTLIYLIFILIDEEDVKENWEKLIPTKYRSRVADVVDDLGKAMNVYFRGQLKIALILSVVYIIGFSIVGLPLSLVLGLLAGLLSLIPYFALLSVPPVMLSAGLVALDHHGAFWPPMIGALAVYAVAQTLEGLVLTPRIQGKNTGLRPEYILLALSVWGSLLGVTGMIIALPLTTVIISYYRRVVLGEQPEEKVVIVLPTVPPSPSPGPSS